MKNPARIKRAKAAWDRLRLGIALPSGNPTALIREQLPATFEEWATFYYQHEDKFGRTGKERIERSARALRAALPELTYKQAVNFVAYRYIDAPWEQEATAVALARLALPLGADTGKWDGVRFLKPSSRNTYKASLLLTQGDDVVFGVWLVSPWDVRNEQTMTALAIILRQDTFPAYPQMKRMMLVTTDDAAAGRLKSVAWISPTDSGR